MWFEIQLLGRVYNKIILKYIVFYYITVHLCGGGLIFP